MISRIFRGENENAAVKRKRQIDTLKIFNDNVAELREDVEYQVQFDAGETRMAIMVSLPPEFPLEKPVLRVSPPVTHPWCNEHSEITSAPGLLNFTIHSDLGRVVQAIIREFSKNPPQLTDDISLTNQSRELQDRISPPYGFQRYPELQSTLYNTYYNSQYPAYSTSSGSNYKYNYVNSCISNQDQFTSSLHRPTYTSTGSPGNSNSIGTASPVQYSNDHRPVSYINSHNYNTASYNKPVTINPPPHTAVSSPEFPELNNLTNEQLVKLAEETDSLDAFLSQHSQLKDINLLIDETIDSVEILANDNLAKETELKTLKEEVASKIKSVSELKAHYDNLISQYSKLSQVFAPDHIRECLKQAADESHEQSELIAENFINRKIDVEHFLSSYIECRKLGQARRTKEEKLGHQLNELKRADRTNEVPVGFIYFPACDDA
ncbi:vacuolar protein sorting-associated protein 37A [Microplitis mediator]|uniref:vacuolar protein sorting-associated protein 37A n=1 Tax=Microplitis mediator TaxID=375433 RepID=UPI0025546408|nr:vacuolar protein sorting-associated protein 37A [Microplitis mediator]